MSKPYILLWNDDNSVLLDQKPETATMTDLRKTLLLMDVLKNAEEELAGLGPHARAVLDAYVNGFNDCFHRDEARWTDQFRFVKAYGLDKKDLTAIEVLARMNYFWVWGQIANIQGMLKEILANPDISPLDLELPVIDYEGSSNEWYIAGRHMADGKMVHATDPHIPLVMSGTYGLTFRSVVGRFAGAGLIGVPGMLIGSTTSTRGNVAWTITAAGPDGSDFYHVETVSDGHSYLTSDGDIQPFETTSYVVGDEIFTLRNGRYGIPFLSLPTSNRVVSLKSVTAEPLRTFEWSLAMDEVSSMAEFHQALALPDGTPWGLHGLNIMAISNRLDSNQVREVANYTLIGRVPYRAGDFDRTRKYRGILDSLDPLNEWIGGYYSLDEMPQSYDPPDGYFANCNVSPAVTDKRIGNNFPRSIIYSSDNLTTLRQLSFETRIQELVDSGPVTLDELLAFATDSRAMHWEMIIEVVAQSYILHGDPLNILPDDHLTTAYEALPLAYKLLVNLFYMRHNDGIRADDSHAAALMHAYVFFLQQAAKEADDPEVIQLAGGGRPVAFKAFTTRESTLLAIQTFFKTVEWFLKNYDVTTEPPTLGDLLVHCFFDATIFGDEKKFTCTRASGGGGSFRTIHSVSALENKNTGKLHSLASGGSGFYQLSRFGDPGDVQVHLIKPYTSWHPSDPLGMVMPRRFAEYKFTEVAIPPDNADVVRRIVR